MSWQLLIGGNDVTGYLNNGASFREVASSVQGQALFTLTGSHASAVVGATVDLYINSVLMWEGLISGVVVQPGSSTLVTANTLAALFAVPGSASVTIPTDAGNIFSLLAEDVGIPYSTGNIDVAIGSLSVVSTIDKALSVVATASGGAWAVRNSSLVFLSASQGTTNLALSFSGVPNSASLVVLTSGTDALTRVPLSISVAPIGAPLGPIVQFDIPEVADAPALALLANTYAQWYANTSVSESLTLAVGGNFRAGSWFVDLDGLVLPAWDVKHSLVQGQFVDTILFGYPLVANPFSHSATAPAQSRLSSDFTAKGGAFSGTGWGASRWGLSGWGE